MSISDESTPMLLNFLRSLGVDTSREFIINETKCALVNGRISEVGNTYGAPNSIYQKVIARYEEWLYQQVNKNSRQMFREYSLLSVKFFRLCNQLVID